MEHATYCVCVRVAKKRARELRAEPGVVSVLVDAVGGQLLVRFDPALTSEQELRRRVHARVLQQAGPAHACAEAAAAERRSATAARTERAAPAWPYLTRFQELLFALVAK